MKTKLMALAFASLMNADLFATQSASDAIEVSDECEASFKGGFYSALALDFFLTSVTQKFDSDKTLEKKYATRADGSVADDFVNAAGTKVNAVGAGAAPTGNAVGLYRYATKDSYIKRSKSSFQFGGSLELGYEHVINSFLVGVYAAVGLAGNTKDKSFKDVENKTEKDNDYVDDQKILPNQLFDGTTYETKSFTLRAGLTLGYVMQAQLLAMYAKFGFLKRDLEVKTAVGAIVNVGDSGPDTKTPSFSTTSKYTKIMPEIGLGFKKQFANNMAVGVEALYAFGSSADNKDEKYKDGIPACDFVKHGNGAVSADNEKVRENNLKAGNIARLSNKISQNVLTFRIYGQYTFA